MEKAVLDTYAWIEYFRGTEEGEKVREYVDGDSRILTPSVVVAELRDKYVRTGLEERWRTRKHFLKMKSDILELEFDVADEAGGLKWDLREKFDDVGLADAIILSHTIQEDATLLTGDDHLTFRKEVMDISS
ncbi:MAG: PIN domain-containing protein [Candidatus Nanohalobium sp.]